MILPNVLSTLRQLILDIDNIPVDFAGRLDFYKARFPALSPIECDDFAKIPPARIKTYTTSIFVQQHKLLESRFPITFALLRMHWSQATGEEFDPFRLARAVHRFRPWGSGQTSELVTNFSHYIAQGSNELVRQVPFLPEVSKLELAAYFVAKMPNPIDRDLQLVQLSEVEKMTVGKLMELRFIRLPATSFELFSYDLPAYSREYFRLGRNLPEAQPEKRDLSVIVSRAPDYSIHWSEISAGVSLYLLRARPNIPKSIEDLAQAFVDGLVSNEADSSRTESEIFKEFAAKLGELVRGGAIAIIE